MLKEVAEFVQRASM